MALRIVKFENDNCVPCKNMGELLDSLDVPYEAQKPFDNPDLAVKHRVRTVPTLLLLNGEEEVQRVIGFKHQEIVQLVEAFKA